VHPWYVHETSPGWLHRLRALLLAHPRAIVGEVGLCKCAKNLRGPGNKATLWPRQLDACAQQLALAAELRRPASVHCVQALGGLTSIFKALLHQSTGATNSEETAHLALLTGERGAAAVAETNAPEGSAAPTPVVPAWRRLPPAVALHSFSGTASQVAGLLRLETADAAPKPGGQATANRKARRARRGVLPPTPPPGAAAVAEAERPNTTFYFGFSHTINVGRGQAPTSALLASIRAVPDDRVLVESDEVGGSNDGGEGSEGSSEGALGRCAAATVLAVRLVAAAKGWTCEEARARTAANGQRFLSAGRQPQEDGPRGDAASLPPAGWASLVPPPATAPATDCDGAASTTPSGYMDGHLSADSRSDGTRADGCSAVLRAAAAARAGCEAAEGASDDSIISAFLGMDEMRVALEWGARVGSKP
jgi:Tat protein secretion system quality control protein TatD with DNase activity